MRQIPYTMMKFACFERTVELLYKHVVPKPRSECSKGEQLIVTFVAGYIGTFPLALYVEFIFARFVLPNYDGLLCATDCERSFSLTL